MVKRPEIEEASKSNTLNQINSRIQSVLSNATATNSRDSASNIKSESLREDFRQGEFREVRNYSDIQSHSTIQTSQSVWEQFEAMKRQDFGDVSEEAFLRDLIYVLQGLEGNLLLFSESEGRYVVNGRIHVVRPIKSLVEKLGKIGIDYRYLQIQVGVYRENAGVLRQSFCRAMAQELAEYLKLVAYLESSLNEKEGSEGSMSLKKVVYWFHEAGILLNFLRELVRDTENLRGGEFLSFLEQFRQHGNDQIRAVITRILDQMMLPYGEMLQGWLREGSLNDPFGEFFISEVNRSSRSFDFDGSDFWNQKFVLKMSELPKFIPETLAKRALTAGKTRKFIQAFLKNPPTHLRYQNPAALSIQSDRDCLSSAVLRENLLESMEKEMKLAYKNACKQVRRILVEDCQLIEQVRCIKQYVLLCKGDFSMNLLELLWDGLNRPAGSLFRHNLVGVLESSIECTRDPREPDWLLANLDVRLLSNDQISGSSATGWDVFALDYRVSFPVDCILDPQSMQEYSKLSRYIWGLKRLEAVLSRCWQNLRDCQISVSKVVKKELRADLRKMELLQYEMISFVRQALSVCFETISGEWDVFEDILNKMSEKDESSEGEGVDLDALITAHRDFLNNLKGKLRLWSSQAMRSKMSVISLGILRFENVQNALISILQSQSLAPSLNEMRNAFQSSARHFQTDLDDLLMTLQKESALNNSEDLVSRLDFNEYHRRRNGFDTRKYL
jgi:gamma-tubulin complex component 3